MSINHMSTWATNPIKAKIKLPFWKHLQVLLSVHVSWKALPVRAVDDLQLHPADLVLAGFRSMHLGIGGVTHAYAPECPNMLLVLRTCARLSKLHTVYR